MPWIRDGASCVWCGRAFGGMVTPTTDHLVPRTKGGPSWLQNEVAACRRCNADRGHRSPVDWLTECEARGWQPRRDVVVAVLGALAVAIDERGGHRKALGYVDAQLRRLR